MKALQLDEEKFEQLLARYHGRVIVVIGHTTIKTIDDVLPFATKAITSLREHYSDILLVTLNEAPDHPQSLQQIVRHMAVVASTYVCLVQTSNEVSKCELSKEQNDWISYMYQYTQEKNELDNRQTKYHTSIDQKYHWIFNSQNFPHICGVISIGGDESIQHVVQAVLRYGLAFLHIPCQSNTDEIEDVMDTFVQKLELPQHFKTILQSNKIEHIPVSDNRYHLDWFDNPEQPINTCLTMHQPWASLVISGLKRIEGRTWPSDFSGVLWIHAAAKIPSEEEINTIEEQYRTIYKQSGISDITFPSTYPTSCLLGCVYVQKVVSYDTFQSSIRPYGPPSLAIESESPYMFLCETPHRLLAPFTISGQHKLWSLDKKLVRNLTDALLPVHGPEPVDFNRLLRGEK